MCRSVTLPTCGAHRPVPTNGSRSYIRFLTRNSGCTHLHSTTEMSTSSSSFLDFWQTGYKSLHYSNVPSQRSEHHLWTRTVFLPASFNIAGYNPPASTGKLPVSVRCPSSHYLYSTETSRRQGERNFIAETRHASGNASTIPYEWRRDSKYLSVPPLV